MILDAGDAFFDNYFLIPGREASAKLKAWAVLNGCDTMGYNIFNVGRYDLAAGLNFLNQLQDSTKAQFISANIYNAGTDQLYFKPHIILERNGIKIGITGLTTAIPSAVKELEIKDFLARGQAEVDTLAKQADIVVVLLNAPRVEVMKAQKAFKNANYIFASRETSRTRPELPQSKEGPLLYSFNIQGKYLGRFDIVINNPQNPLRDVTSARLAYTMVTKRLENLQKRDPNRSLEDIYKDKPNILKMISSYREKLSESQSTLNQALNTSTYTLVPLSSKIESEPSLLTYVDQTLKTCSDLDKQALSGKL